VHTEDGSAGAASTLPSNCRSRLGLKFQPLPSPPLANCVIARLHAWPLPLSCQESQPVEGTSRSPSSSTIAIIIIIVIIIICPWSDSAPSRVYTAQPAPAACARGRSISPQRRLSLSRSPNRRQAPAGGCSLLVADYPRLQRSAAYRRNPASAARELDSPAALPPDPSASRSWWPAHAALGGLICSASRPVLAESGAPGGSKPPSLKLLDSRCRRQWQTGGVSICRLSPLRRPSALPLRASDLPASRSGRLAAALRRCKRSAASPTAARPPPSRTAAPFPGCAHSSPNLHQHAAPARAHWTGGCSPLSDPPCWRQFGRCGPSHTTTLAATESRQPLPVLLERL